MNLGISTYSYTWAVGVPGKIPDTPMNLETLLGKAQELDVGLIQISDNLPLVALSQQELEEFFAKAESLGISLEAGARGMTEESLERYIGIAETIHSPILRFVIDNQQFRPDMETILGIISNALPELKKKNIILALENYEKRKAREFAEIVEKAGSSQIGICLDSVNSIGAGEGLETVVELLGPLTVNLHIKEFTIRRLYHNMGFELEGLPAGEGMLNLPWLMQHVSDRCRSAVLEQWVTPEADLEATIQKEDEWAKKSINYLKKLF